MHSNRKLFADKPIAKPVKIQIKRNKMLKQERERGGGREGEGELENFILQEL